MYSLNLPTEASYRFRSASVENVRPLVALEVNGGTGGEVKIKQLSRGLLEILSFDKKDHKRMKNKVLLA